MSLEDKGYTEIVKRIPLTDEEVCHYRRALQLSDYMRKRVNELVAVLIEESYQREEEMWEALRAKTGLNPADSHRYVFKAVWGLGEIHVMAKPDMPPPDEPDQLPVSE